MSSLAKQAREAMKAKASRLTTADPHQKVDSSTWTPAEALNTEVKTGMRPVSRRAYKSGGKVGGTKAKVNLGKKPRASGGKAITADSLINRNAKEANEQRPGGDAHVGGYKKGGAPKRKGRDGGGRLPGERTQLEQARRAAVQAAEDYGMDSANNTENLRNATRNFENKVMETGYRDYKKGGRAKSKKADGGSLDAAKQMMSQAQKTVGVPAGGIYGAGFSRTGAGSLSPASALGKSKLKKGGVAKHDDVKQDMALIKKMVKPEARAARKEGGGVFTGTSYPGKIPGVVPGGREAHATRGRVKTADDIAAEYAMRGPDEAMQSIVAGGLPPHVAKAYGLPITTEADRGLMNSMYDDAMQRSMENDARRAALNEMYNRAMSNSPSMGEAAASEPTGMDYPGTFSGVDMPRRNGGRTTRATGGKAKGKGKTHINIMIAPGKPGIGDDMMPPGGPTLPPGMGGAPGGFAPVPMPPPGGAQGGPPMPIPMPMPMPAGPAPGPAPRKAGGRLTAKASSYKDMTAGSGSGEGRLQKTDIAAYKRAKHKAGGKVYKSYKDMDAGSGSGLGRLEKTEIQKRKG